MQLLGYGEDALTFWALTNRLPAILSSLGDEPSEAVTVYYRPSFGRRSATSPTITERGPQFGEFDGIIVSHRGVYLLEAKWSNSGEILGDTIALRPEQIRRHRIFWRYLAAWTEAGVPDWSAFSATYPSLTVPMPNGQETFRVAPAGSRLAQNLEAILRRCAHAGPAQTDVLLVVHPGARPGGPLRSGPNGFQIIELDCPDMVGGFIPLGAA